MTDKKNLVSDQWLKMLNDEIRGVTDFVRDYCNGKFISSLKITISIENGSKASVEVELTKTEKNFLVYNYESKKYEGKND